MTNKTMKEAKFFYDFLSLCVLLMLTITLYEIVGPYEPAPEDLHPIPVAAFEESEIILSKISGQKGQILNVYCFPGMKSCSYSVRFAVRNWALTSSQNRQGNLSEIREAPFTRVAMEEYELEKLP